MYRFFSPLGLGCFLGKSVLVNDVIASVIIFLFFVALSAVCEGWGGLHSPKNRPNRVLLDCHVISPPLTDHDGIVLEVSKTLFTFIVASNSTDTTLTGGQSDEEKDDGRDDLLTALRICRRDRPAKKNFSEPMSDQEATYPPVFTGAYNKLGAAPSGVVASQYDIICVDTVPFQGESHFPTAVTETLRELRDIACIAVP